MNYHRIIAALTIAPMLLGGSVSRGLAAEEFLIVVNKDNDILKRESDVEELLRRIYLKEVTSWPGGERAVFFGRPSDSPEEQAFRMKILNMSDDGLEEHWTRLKQIRGETPPRAISSTRILLRQIDSKKYAVGVVSKRDFESLVDLDGSHRVISTIKVDGASD